MIGARRYTILTNATYVCFDLLYNWVFLTQKIKYLTSQFSHTLFRIYIFLFLFYDFSTHRQNFVNNSSWLHTCTYVWRFDSKIKGLCARHTCCTYLPTYIHIHGTLDFPHFQRISWALWKRMSHNDVNIVL